jgi:hypothetical protein
MKYTNIVKIPIIPSPNINKMIGDIKDAHNEKRKEKEGLAALYPPP